MRRVGAHLLSQATPLPVTQFQQITFVCNAAFISQVVLICVIVGVYVNYVPEDDRIQVHPAEAYDLAQVYLWLSNFKK